VALCIFVLFSILYAITLIEVDPVFVTIAIIIFGLTPKQSISKKLKISNGLLRLILAIIILTMIGKCTEVGVNKERKAKEIEEASKLQREKQLKENLNLYNENPDKIINIIKNDFNSNKMESVSKLSDDFKLSNNKEIIDLGNNAKSILNATKTKELLRSIDTLSSFDYEGLLKVYEEILRLNPGHTVYNKKIQEIKELQTKEINKNNAINNPGTYLKIEKSSWSIEGFGNVAVGSFNIKNTAEVPYKDITIACEFYGKSGTTVSKAKYISYDSIKPLGHLKIANANLGFIDSQSAKMGCIVIDAKTDY
jgi:hypothetical protein